MYVSRRGIAAALICLLVSIAAAADQPTKQFIRIQRDADKTPVSLQTAIVRYLPADSDEDPISVDLVGAVHVGEKQYYDELNKLFKDYDAVLYELVAAEDANVPARGQRSGHPVSLLQVSMKNVLQLEFQLDCVDYRRANFVHADLTPTQFAKSMEDRGESFTKLMFRMMGQGVAQQSGDPGRTNDFAMLSAFFSKDRSRDLKRVLAQQFEEMEKANAVLDGPDGSTIITERNRRAIQVLKDQIAAGKKKIAIFYGAAHLPDFDNRLREEFRLKPASERWIEAWKLVDASNSSSKKKSKTP